MKRTLRVELGEFGRSALEKQAGQHRLSAEELLRAAVLYYLGELGSGRVALRPPRFARRASAASPNGEGLEVELDLAGPDWRGLELQAGRQRVSLEGLIEHAALYFLADVDAGRITLRILERAGETD
jgi:hypothetical protein